MALKAVLVLALLGALLFAGGCVQQQAPSQEELALNSCKALCSAELQKGTDLSSGPCIGNPLPEEKDWVCDIAHEPRAAVDDLQQNQCSAFREGKATHFVELGPNCKELRTY